MFSAMFHAPTSVKNRGVLIRLSKKLKLQGTVITKEPEGQFLIIESCIVGKKWTLVEAYAPQLGKTMFFKKLTKKLEQYGKGNLILMRDFNAVVAEVMDMSMRGSSQSSMPRLLRMWLADKNLVDDWRNCHKEERDYTYYLKRHNSYSTTDYIFHALEGSVQTRKIKIGQESTQIMLL